MSNIPIKVKLLLYVVLISLAALIASAAWPQHGLVILFTHDLHSNLEEYSIPDGHDNALIVGGYARLSSAIHKERMGREKNTIVVDGGDFSMGTLFHTIRSSHSAELVTMGAMGYDITTFGNHDFESGPEQLALALLAAKKHSVGKLPAIVAFNTKVDGRSEKVSTLRKAYAVYPVTPYKIIRRAGLKIGVFGLMGKDAAADVPQAVPVVFEDHIEAARRAVDILRNKEKVDMVICLSHSGTWADKNISEDEIMARCVPGIDVIISGHTHTVLEHYILIGSTIIVSSGAYGRYLGCLEVSRSRGTAFKVTDYRLVEIASGLPKDPVISRLVSSFIKNIEDLYLAQYHYRYGQPLARCAFSLPRAVNSGLGNLVGDAFRYAVRNKEGADYREISLVIEPYGQIRVPLAKGIITVNDAFRVMASGYPLVSFWLTGKEVKNALEIETTVAPLKEDAHLQVTGVRFSYDPKAAPYARIKTADVENTNGTLEPLDDSRLYRVCSNWYVLLMSEYLKSMPGSQLSFILKDKNGDPVAPVRMELKEWQALAAYLQSFPASATDILPQVPEKYRN